MKNLTNIEVFNIEITEEGTFAHISFQDLNNTDNVNNGYDNIRVPMNLRPIQLSVRDNILVDQSVKNYEDGVVAEVTKILNNHNN
jgi:hypothetical protein